MRRRAWEILLLSTVVVAGLAGCTTTSDQLPTFAGDFLRQLLAAFAL